jgi:hypothetical protein
MNTSFLVFCGIDTSYGVQITNDGRKDYPRIYIHYDEDHRSVSPKPCGSSNFVYYYTYLNIKG